MAQQVASAPSPEFERTGRRKTAAPRRSHQRDIYGALDLGTNNCRLLIARPSEGGFTVLDAFSRIVRLGEGLSTQRQADARVRWIEQSKRWRSAPTSSGAGM